MFRFVVVVVVVVVVAFTEATALRSIVRSSICMRPNSYTQLPHNCLCPFLFLFLPFFCFFVDVAFSESCITVFSLYCMESCCLKKIRTHPDLLSMPQSGGKNVKTFRWDHRLQIQNLFMAFKRVPLW